MFENDVNHLVDFEIAFFSEINKGFVVLEYFSVNGVFFANAQSSQAFRPIFDVLFGIISDAKGEQFEQFPTQVFVEFVFSIVHIVQIAHHCIALNDFLGQGFEVAKSIFPQDLVVLENPVIHFHFLVSGHIMIVPKTSHFFAKRKFLIPHFVNPPRLHSRGSLYFLFLHFLFGFWICRNQGFSNFF